MNWGSDLACKIEGLQLYGKINIFQKNVNPESAKSDMPLKSKADSIVSFIVLSVDLFLDVTPRASSVELLHIER